MRNKRIVIVASSITALSLVFVSIAFAVLATNLNISFGNVTQNALSWNVGFKGDSSNPTFDGTSTTGSTCGIATITPSTITISDTILSKPGDKCTYNFTIQNNGDIAAELSNISATEPSSTSCTITNGSTMVCGNITYQLQTISGNLLSPGITINSKEKYNIALVVSYTGEALSEEKLVQSNAKFTLVYYQSINRVSSEIPDGVESSQMICKRATTLHTETCIRTNGGCYTLGYYSGGSKNTNIITYGSFGTSGTLSSGNAFDCDVNGDGTYDSATERFYYLSGVNGDDSSNYASLIYYTDVSNGEPDLTNKYYYSSTGKNNLGPTTAYLQLPSTAQWSNVSLSNQTRQIYAQNGRTTTVGGGSIVQFTYMDRAARLVDYREVNKACGITIGSSSNGELNNCIYLLEYTDLADPNMGYYWLESPRYASQYLSNAIWAIDGNSRNVGYTGTTTQPGRVRPVIEVPLELIEY